ncbi:MAG: Carbamoyltransferase [Candidatus Roizmanbacteria bacterium GW2011_GWA2_37_7]|uniref:Carbamoyltransferase n=1 Tax=Candidatus Roizmanbacteria bacterium GW2011_GWA2_37_7 TaxID=1618481 RepID=A0A0G0HIW6_9BACT|nr:MAG: Carbamoyltransferase [Candidatus Roizmanbacteria bacterium GW2011_GWA2_37_7]
MGISAFYHDSSAVLIQDGNLICAFEEERFTRRKHDNSFPFSAIQHCLQYARVDMNDIDTVSYYEKPLLKFERILETFVQTYPYSLKTFLKAMPEWLGEKIKIEHIIRKKLKFKKNITYIPHHLSHAASSFYPSPFKNAAILTIDGVGEYQTTGLWRGDGTEIAPISSINFPHSLGLLYSTFTAFLGFQVNNDEYKMMGLGAYGKPSYLQKVNKIITVKKDGSFQLNMKYFGFRESFQMWSQEFEDLFGKPRKNNDRFTQRHKDIAASIQAKTEEIYFLILNHLYNNTLCENLCISGGVALNSLANGKIYERTPFKHVYIFGPAGDSAAALGAALYAYFRVSTSKSREKISHLYFGNSYNNSNIEILLKKNKLNYEKCNDTEMIQKAAQALADGKIIGWFQGRMEFGPRALGNRSILANPQKKSMKEKVNVIKIREQFRPFAGSVLQDNVHELFKVPEKNHESPFMNFVFEVQPGARSKIAAIVHADNTCRIQTISKTQNPLYYRLIKRFYELTGIPCILNTSFNLKSEPIVESPEQAVEDFNKTSLDELYIYHYYSSKD